MEKERETGGLVIDTGDKNLRPGLVAEQGLAQNVVGSNNFVGQLLVFGQLADEGQDNGDIVYSCGANGEMHSCRSEW